MNELTLIPADCDDCDEDHVIRLVLIAERSVQSVMNALDPFH